MGAPVQLEEILLVDDNEADCFLHRRVIRKLHCAKRIVAVEDGQECLDYLTTEHDGQLPRPDLIFLDLNMPRVDGWQFLDRYESSSIEHRPVIVLLTTSLNPDDELRASAIESLSGFQRKPLTTNRLRDVLSRYFPDHHW